MAAVLLPHPRARQLPFFISGAQVLRLFNRDVAENRASSEETDVPSVETAVSSEDRKNCTKNTDKIQADKDEKCEPDHKVFWGRA